MEKIYHNIKMLMLIILISAICVNLGIVEDFFWMFITLVFFFSFFTKWKIKKLTYKKEEKHFLLMFIPLGLLFSFFIEKETIFNIPKEDIGLIISALVSIIVMRITEYVNRGKPDRDK